MDRSTSLPEGTTEGSLPEYVSLTVSADEPQIEQPGPGRGSTAGQYESAIAGLLDGVGAIEMITAEPAGTISVISSG